MLSNNELAKYSAQQGTKFTHLLTKPWRFFFLAPASDLFSCPSRHPDFILTLPKQSIPEKRLKCKFFIVQAVFLKE